MTESSDYLDSWDPLTDDYNDKNSNSYVTGAGANLPSHMQPANYRKDHGNSYVLWVRPLSSRYTEESLKNIFSNYGEVTDVSIIQPKFGDRSSFGYVVYKSQASANDAIRRFNDDPKFDFKVNYAKDESVQKLFQKLERKKSQSQNHRDYSNHVDNNKSFRQGNSQHRRSNYYDKVDDSYSDDRSTRNSRSHQSTRDSVRSNSPLPEKTDRSIISFAFSQDLFPSEKKSRDIQPVEINGFDSKSAVETSIMKPSVVYQTLPQCSSCQKKTFMKCSCCGQNFCNQECSMNGWRHHTGNCIQVAALQHEDSTKAVTVSLNNNVSAPLPPQPHFMNDKDFANLAKDYTASSKIYEDPSVLQASTRVNRVDNNYDDNVDGVGYGSRRNDVPKPESRQIRLENGEYESSAKRGEANIGFDRKKPVKRDNDEEDRQRRAGGDSNKSYPVNTNHGKNNAQSRIDRNRMIGGYKRTDDESFTPQANSSAIDDVDVNPFLTSRYRLSLGKMAKVIVLSSVQKEESQGYVRFVDEDDTYKAFHKLLNDYKSFQPHHEDSRKCLARYKNSWCRGFVVGTKSPLRVRLIDEGLYQNFASEDLREVPTPFAQVVPFSHFVQYVNVELSQLQSWAVANEVITIKPIKEENKVWMVEVIPEEPLHEQLEKARKIRDQVSSESVERVPRKKEASPKKPTTPATSVSVPQKPKKNERVLAAGVPISVFVSYVKDDRVFFVAKGEDLLDVNLRLEKEDESKLPPLTEIEPGTMCIGIFCGLCCRAKVLSKDPLRVLYIDYGNEEIAQPGDLKVLPASYENIPPLAIRVKLLEGTVTDGKVIENSEVLITPIKEEKDVPNSWIVCVGDKSSQYKELLSRIESTESVASKSPKSAATAPTVRNTPPKEPVPPVVMDACVTYAVSKSEYYCIKKADVGLFESTITQMTNFTEKAKTVEKGKVYANLFDGLWCRAQVVDTEPLTIYFIDYGNTEICTKDDLYELPEKLQHNPPPLAFRVSLKNESQELLDYGRFMNLLWDVKADSYTLLRDPSATLDDNTAASGAVSSK